MSAIVADIRGWELRVDPAGLTCVPDGEYVCRFLGYETAFLFSTGKVITKFAVVEGEYANVQLIRPYRAKRLLGKPGKNGRFEIGRSSELLRDVVRLNDMKVRPDRLSLQFLSRCLWLVKTRTVDKDYQQRPIPEPLRYSVIDRIVEGHTN